MASKDDRKEIYSKKVFTWVLKLDPLYHLIWKNFTQINETGPEQDPLYKHTLDLDFSSEAD